MNKNAMAKFFYEQCAGSSSGHMSMIPNNPVLYGLIQSLSGGGSSTHAATKEEFAEILRAMANDIEADKF